MTDLDFRISTRRTGIRRLIRVSIYAEHADFMTAYHRESRRRGLADGTPDGYRVEGACLPAFTTWEDRDPRPYQARILLALEYATAATIAHEATHAALHLYSVDCYRDNARAGAHLHVGNEIIPYTVGDIFVAIAQRLLDAGHALHVGTSGTDPG